VKRISKGSINCNETKAQGNEQRKKPLHRTGNRNSKKKKKKRNQYKTTIYRPSYRGGNAPYDLTSGEERGGESSTLKKGQHGFMEGKKRKISIKY